MPRVTIAVDLTKAVSQLDVSEESGRISERKRLTRLQFLRFWENRAPAAFRWRCAAAPTIGAAFFSPAASTSSCFQHTALSP
ncbi:hypothetical protein BH23GEM6_BH23GEM6_14710 [soil metagenome]